MPAPKIKTISMSRSDNLAIKSGKSGDGFKLLITFDQAITLTASANLISPVLKTLATDANGIAIGDLQVNKSSANSLIFTGIK
jgi:hypothetical protein